MRHAERQIDQVRRRLLEGEKIPHHEKVFSVFEEHARRVVKGKGGVPQEPGVPVCVLEDQYRFILHHEILWEGHDVDYACTIVSETRARFPEVRACSFDRGFHSPENQRQLAVLLDQCILPVKGYLNAESAARESEEGFRNARRQHPGVESAINHLEHCGLARIRSHGRAGFARAVSLSVLSANVKRLGRLLREQERKRLQRRKRLRTAWTPSPAFFESPQSRAAIPASRMARWPEKPRPTVKKALLQCSNMLFLHVSVPLTTFFPHPSYSPFAKITGFSGRHYILDSQKLICVCQKNRDFLVYTSQADRKASRISNILSH